MSTYEIADTNMPAGSTFGAPKAVVVIKSTGAIEKFYSIDAGLTLIGTVLVQHWDEPTGVRLSALPGTFSIHPDRQEHRFVLSNGLTVCEDIFILNGLPEGSRVDAPAAYYSVRLSNDTTETVGISSYASAQLRGAAGHDVVTTHSKKNNALVAWNASDPSIVRTFGSSVSPTSFEATRDSGKASATSFPGILSGTTLARASDPIGILHFSHTLEPGEYAEFSLLLTCSVKGRAAAARIHATVPTAKRARERTREHYNAILKRAVVVTPDPEVNRGVLWAKANMLRTPALAQTGWSFVNDPTRSNNSVARDTAWFAFGADYIIPDFARESLLWYAKHLKRNGMVVEYYDIRNGKSADYGLNINDNTPLLILALWHHYNTTGDLAFLKEVYPHALKAARYILSQRNEQGLVWCDATGVADWGIVGWRNVIANYRLAGATTEVNSECFAALGTIGHMARALKKHSVATAFASHAEELRSAINRHLLNPDTGLYYLNIDLNGRPRTDVTSDLVFPVMFGVADDETAAHIVSRLSVPEFWRAAGIHTVPRHSINYGPTHGYGLLGGIWVGVTFWYAFAAARFNPALMAHALGASFSHYSSDPLRNNTVPGQFSEWLHGETLTNQGMMLSPWFPPRYLWAAIEGAAGLDLTGESPSVSPRLAPEWKWLGVRNLTLAGDPLTWFVARVPKKRMYATFGFQQSTPYEAYDEDITDLAEVMGDQTCAIVLRKARHIVIFVGNTIDRTITTSISLRAGAAGRYTVRVFNSLRGAWVDAPSIDANGLRRGFPLHIDGKGFSLIELQQEA
jgi:hypothetical protein